MAARELAALMAEIQECHHELDALAGPAEELGTAPTELVDVLRRIRTPMVKAPREIGGDQLSMPDQLSYFAALSYANPTAAWIGFNHAGTAGMAGAMLSDAGVETVFGVNPAPMFAGSSVPSGRFTSVEGGVTVTGIYRYASGSPHAEWILLPALDAAGSQVRLLVVDATDADIGGEWNVMALKGTGSVDVAVVDAFVPDERLINPADGLQRGGPMYGVGYQTYVAGENFGFTLGVCERFFDELGAYATTKSRMADGRLADRGAFQYEFGKGRLCVESSRALAERVLTEAHTSCMATGGLTPGQEQHVVSALAYCTETATNAVSHLFHFAGAGALFDSNVLQRCFRDAHGSVQHHVASNIAYDKYGHQCLDASLPGSQ